MLHPIYYIMMFFLTYFSYLEVSNNNSIKTYTKIPYIISAIILTIFAGIRVAQGADYWTYFQLYIVSNQYIKWNEIWENTNLEPSYILISKVLGSWRMPFFTLLLTYACIAIPLKTFTFYKISPYPFFTLLFYYMSYFFFQEMGHIRQGVSIAFCLFSYQFIAQKKLFYYLFFVLLGYYFHKATIIFLPAYWIANMNISTIQSMLLIGLSIIISPFQPYNWFGDLFNSLSEKDMVSSAFNSYQSLEEAGFSITDIVKIIFLAIIFISDKYNVHTNPDKNYMKIRNLVVVYYCIYYAFRENIIFSVRLPVCYDAFFGILLAIMIKNSKSTFSKYLLYSCIVIYLYLFSIRFWENAQKLGFDRFNTIFSENYNNTYFIPYKFAD